MVGMINILVLLIVVAMIIAMAVLFMKRKSEGKEDEYGFAKKEKDRENKNKVVLDSDPSISNYLFYLIVEDVFSITGRGAVATGKILKGEIKKGDTVYIETNTGELIEEKVLGIETMRKIKTNAVAGDNVGIMFSKNSKSYIERGCKVLKKIWDYYEF